MGKLPRLFTGAAERRRPRVTILTPASGIAVTVAGRAAAPPTGRWRSDRWVASLDPAPGQRCSASGAGSQTGIRPQLPQTRASRCPDWPVSTRATAAARNATHRRTPPDRRWRSSRCVHPSEAFDAAFADLRSRARHGSRTASPPTCAADPQTGRPAVRSDGEQVALLRALRPGRPPGSASPSGCLPRVRPRAQTAEDYHFPTRLPDELRPRGVSPPAARKSGFTAGGVPYVGPAMPMYTPYLAVPPRGTAGSRPGAAAPTG